MAKRLNLLHYILNESTSSTIFQVYEALKQESRKGDFYSLSQKDLQDLNIKLNEVQIKEYSKTKWKTYVKNVIKDCAFKHLSAENAKLENTKEITFSELRTSEYLLNNRNTRLSKIIFSLRSRTFDIKTWQPWKYFDNLCVSCEIKEETMNHFLTCKSYEDQPCEENWEEIKGNCIERQHEIAIVVKARNEKRKEIIERAEAGHP